MTEQKYWQITDEEFISYYGGNAYLISNGDCKFHIWETKEDAQKVCDLLNELTNKGVEYDSFRLKVALSIQHRINWLKELKEIGDYQAMRIRELDDENQFIKHVINEALTAERTELGKSVLKQLKQQIEVR